MKNLQKKIQATESAYDVCTEDLFTQVTQNLIEIQREQSKCINLARRRRRYLLQNPVIHKQWHLNLKTPIRRSSLKRWRRRRAMPSLRFPFTSCFARKSQSHPDLILIHSTPTFSNHNGNNNIIVMLT